MFDRILETFRRIIETCIDLGIETAKGVLGELVMKIVRIDMFIPIKGKGNVYDEDNVGWGE